MTTIANTTVANKTSIRVPYQLPEFIRSDENYQTFIAFLQAYYEWMEHQDIGTWSANNQFTASGKEGAIYGSQSLYSNIDIDTVEPGDSYNKFIDYFFNDFLPNFPKDALADKAKLIKIARELYQTKGTPASYQFLFRALYNSDAEIFLTRDVVLRASDGKWYVSKSLKLDTEDSQFLSIDNFRLFGETSKSIATVERSILSGTRTEVYISNIERLFQSGEFVRVVDNNNNTLYFKDGKVVPEGTAGSASLRAKIIGSISSVQINPSKRGQLYTGRSASYSGDPVIFYGGLSSSNGIGATAFVNEVTSGSVRDVLVTNGSYGYRADPNTDIIFTGGGGSGAIATVASLDPTGEINVVFIPTNYISAGIKARQIGSTYDFFSANTTSDANCTLANAFSFISFSTYPITGLVVQNGGGGYTSIPAVAAESTFNTTDPANIVKGKLGSLGMLGPIEIVAPGTGYANGDIIVFTNSAGGVGANANVTVNATGSIISATYRYVRNANNTVFYPLGGLGYRNRSLPTLEVQSSGGSGAQLRVNQVLGTGAEFDVIPDERGIGAITSIVVENYGEDYTSAPQLTLKVRDIVVSNLVASALPQKGDVVYQGTSIDNYVFKANVDSISVLLPNQDALQTKYVLRTYNYTSNTKTNLQLKVTDRPAGPNLYIDLDATYDTLDDNGNYIFRSGIRTYGNGAAQATAKFLNGLITGNGQYLNDDGFPSSFRILQSKDYNNFTYDLTVQKSFESYKDALYKLLHPAGAKVVPINALKSSESINVSSVSFESNSLPLSFYTGAVGSNATVYATFANPSNNIIKFDALVGANIASFINVNTLISITNTHGPNLYSTVTSVNLASNTVTVSDNVFLRFANVAFANTISSNSKINITEVTKQYELINNGEWSNTDYKLYDLAFIGDSIRVYANASHDYTGTITYVSYTNNAIFVTPSPSFNATKANVWIGRNLVSTSVEIYNTLGEAGVPYLTTQAGDILITEDNRVITLGI
jgi:hypothetical protein